MFIYEDEKDYFEQEYKVLNLEMEYRGLVGDVKYAIITDLDREELNLKYGERIERYSPYVLLTNEMGTVIREFEKNDDKFRKRSARTEDSIEANEERELIVTALSNEAECILWEIRSFEEQREKQIEDVCHEALCILSEKQRRYLTKYYLEEKSLRAISKEEGVAPKNISKTLKRAVDRFMRVFEEKGVA